MAARPNIRAPISSSPSSIPQASPPASNGVVSTVPSDGSIVRSDPPPSSTGATVDQLITQKRKLPAFLKVSNPPVNAPNTSSTFQGSKDGLNQASTRPAASKQMAPPAKPADEFDLEPLFLLVLCDHALW